MSQFASGVVAMRYEPRPARWRRYTDRMASLRHWWHDTRERLSRRLKHRVTRAGIAYAGSMILVAVAAFLSGNNLLFLILAAMLATFMASGFISRMGLAGLELDLLIPQHTSARRKVRAGVRLRNDKPWIPSFSVHLQGAAESGFNSILYFPVIPSRTTVEESAELYFAHRGKHRERTFQFSTRFPFGFAERREFITIRQDILVYPCLDPQPGFEALLASITGEMEAMQRGRGSDFYRVRPYEHLESARHVDWKATAHTGALQVREFAREQDRSVVIYLDLDVPYGQDEWFERAVDCAAFLSHELSARDAAVRVRTQQVDLSTPTDGDIYSILKYLALVTPLRGKPPSWEIHGVGPDETASFHLVFTQRSRASVLGRAARGATIRVLGPGDLSAVSGTNARRG